MGWSISTKVSIGETNNSVLLYNKVTTVNNNILHTFEWLQENCKYSYNKEMINV